MAEEISPDICVIGGGPGGIAAAVTAAAEGVSVVLVEKSRLGGANLAFGGVPSKALLAAADLHEGLRLGPMLGVTGAPLQVNLGKVREHIVAATEAIARNVAPERLNVSGVRVIMGEARFANPAMVVVGETSIRARRFVLAVGSQAVIPAFHGLDTVETMTFADAFELARRPAHLLILGAGRYALELAQAYSRLGIDTTVIDEAAALPDEDPELAAILVDRLRAEGIRVRTGVTIRSMARRRGGIRITLIDPQDAASTGAEVAVDGSHLLVAAGRVPAVEGLGLAAADIASNASGIVVDGNLRTTNRRVYAVGDAVAGPALATRAEVQARAVVRTILYRLPGRADASAVPVVAFTDPALAAVGLGEAEARRRHPDARVLRFPFIENDRAHIERRPAGMIKVVATGGGRILGAAIVGRDAGELIALWSLAVANGLSLAAMRAFVPPYPTRSAISARVASPGDGSLAAVPGLTASWRKRIIEVLRKLG
jgi:pyruvate/2-oxoglutarate dehydrogenase complex dihydrolipoamide dehydrogenase (E3) component